MEENGFLQHPELNPVRRVDMEASASLEDVEGSEALDNERGELRGTGEITSRPIGTKQAKRRKPDHTRDARLAEAVSSIAESQRKQLEEGKHRNSIALMQSEVVPEETRKDFFRALARKLLHESGIEPRAHSLFVDMAMAERWRRSKALILFISSEHVSCTERLWK
jgi:hypothetical protein